MSALFYDSEIDGENCSGSRKSKCQTSKCICFKKNNVNTSYNSYDCSSAKSFDTWIDLRLFYSVIIKRITLYRGSHKLMQLFMRRKRGRGIEQYSWFYIPRHFLEFAAKYTFLFFIWHETSARAQTYSVSKSILFMSKRWN